MRRRPALLPAAELLDRSCHFCTLGFARRRDLQIAPPDVQQPLARGRILAELRLVRDAEIEKRHRPLIRVEANQLFERLHSFGAQGG